jgi:saccharopine dehydrogenase-like NADP-dependent oxidoreductase
LKKILLFGAGRSATVLIDYLLKEAEKEIWKVIVVDANINLAKSKTGDSPFAEAVSFDINDEARRKEFISSADIVISLLPPALHTIAAKTCVELGKNLLTASYVDEEIKKLRSEIENKGLLFLCEMGLDPGIDHMSAMKMIDEIHEAGGKINSFKSHCGGLVAPESDDNPWHYKISWNPRNIVMAGKAGAIFKTNGVIEKIPYGLLFKNCPTVNIPGLNTLVYYPNRDSLSYIPVYGLEETSTFIRTTLRHHDFCKAWHYVIRASLTDEETLNAVFDVSNASIREWLDKNLEAQSNNDNFEELLENEVDKPDRRLVEDLFKFLGLFSNEKIPASAKSSADVLQYLLEKKLSLQPGDKDMIVMQHEIQSTTGNQQSSVSSTLIVKGDDNLKTAMAKTVGLPLGIAAKLILNGKIKLKGLHIPTQKEIYQPVLKELEEFGICFHEVKS